MTIAYSASVAVFAATDLDSLAASSSLVAGLESNVITATTDDAMLSGRFKANNTAPTAGLIQVYVGAPLTWDGTPTYPDVFDGTMSTETVTSADIRNSILVLAASIRTDTTSNRVYEFSPRSIAALFDSVMPQKWWVFVTHSMVQTLNVTGSAGGQCWYQPITFS